MIKIPTYFKKDPNNLSRVINEIAPGCEWVAKCGIPTRKFDGTAAAIINGELYKRYDVKKGRAVPENAIPCQEPDEITGHWPHWVKCDPDKREDKYFYEACYNVTMKGMYDGVRFNTNIRGMYDGTYELCGPKVQGNPEKFNRHYLIPHGKLIVVNAPNDYEGLRKYLQVNDIEGIVFYNPYGRMCKIRKKDFGIKR